MLFLFHFVIYSDEIDDECVVDEITLEVVLDSSVLLALSGITAHNVARGCLSLMEALEYIRLDSAPLGLEARAYRGRLSPERTPPLLGVFLHLASAFVIAVAVDEFWGLKLTERDPHVQ